MTTKSEDWKKLRDEIWGRLREPSRHPIFVLYFVFCIVLVGAAGAWLPYVGFTRPENSCIEEKDWALLGNLLTYSVALAAASFADAALRRSDGSKQFRFLLLVLIISVAVLEAMVLLALVKDYSRSANVCAWLGVVLSLMAWWMANATNPSLREDPAADAPTGGDPQRDLPGSLDGIES